jgi:hypothetical protein
MHASASSQLNVQAGPLGAMPNLETGDPTETWFQNMTTLYMPIFWAQQEAGMHWFPHATTYTYVTMMTICHHIPISILSHKIGIPQVDADEFTEKVYGALFLADLALYCTFPWSSPNNISNHVTPISFPCVVVIIIIVGAIGGTLFLLMGVTFTGMSVRAKRDMKQLDETRSLMSSDTTGNGHNGGSGAAAYGHDGHHGASNGYSNGTANGAAATRDGGDGGIGGVEDGMAYRASARDEPATSTSGAAIDITYHVCTIITNHLSMSSHNILVCLSVRSNRKNKYTRSITGFSIIV